MQHLTYEPTLHPILHQACHGVVFHHLHWIPSHFGSDTPCPPAHFFSTGAIALATCQLPGKEMPLKKKPRIDHLRGADDRPAVRYPVFFSQSADRPLAGLAAAEKAGRNLFS